ncbi:hypothetical protein LAZ67_14000250 [Cordylochernes scorpioides]|uniref:Transposase n=1 Tax=Cordylochernes scorpioides TaxID=51811 RepID=A0ABY6L7G8_9ARAC|nr:hypothetical protein LAZ67_14000250 [Cordylochernes scorpioides]
MDWMTRGDEEDGGGSMEWPCGPPSIEDGAEGGRYGETMWPTLSRGSSREQIAVGAEWGNGCGPARPHCSYKDHKSATEALRTFRTFKGIRSGKGPMSCCSLRRMIKNFEKTRSLWKQKLGVEDHRHAIGDFEKRQEFAAWVFRLIYTDENWLSNFLWTDEAHLYLNGEVNTQNSRIWATENPRNFTEMPLYQPRVTVLCGFISTFIIGPIFFEKINGRMVIPILQNRQALSEITFIQDGGPPHISRSAEQLLKDTFGEANQITNRNEEPHHVPKRVSFGRELLYKEFASSEKPEELSKREWKNMAEDAFFLKEVKERSIPHCPPCTPKRYFFQCSKTRPPYSVRKLLKEVSVRLESHKTDIICQLGARRARKAKKRERHEKLWRSSEIELRQLEASEEPDMTDSIALLPET